MCDTYKKDIDLEDLLSKANGMLKREFKKPTDDQISRCKLLIEEIINSNHILNDNEINSLKRKYQIDGKRSIIFQIYITLIQRGELDDTHEEKIRQTLMIKSSNVFSQCSMQIT
jgi:hypothetical protein